MKGGTYFLGRNKSSPRLRQPGAHIQVRGAPVLIPQERAALPEVVASLSSEMKMAGHLPTGELFSQLVCNSHLAGSTAVL